MLQRVVIAGALSIEPDLLLADEPTTALDVTTQAEVIALLRRPQRERGTGMLFVTHDLDLAAAVCDRVYVMYAGRVVEEATGEALFAAPAYPYTRALLDPSPSVHGDRVAIKAIAGRPRSLPGGGPGPAVRRLPAARRTPPCARRHEQRLPRLRPRMPACPGLFDGDLQEATAGVYFRTSPAFRTDAPAHRWLAETVFVGLARQAADDGVAIRVYAVA